MPVLTICNHKGGTGKTTTSIHLAAALGHQGRRVLVVDFDPQGFLTRMLGASEPRAEHSALGLLDARADLRTFPVQRVSGFDLVGSSMALTKALRQLTKPTDVLWLRETLHEGHDYDLVLLDTAAALSVYTMNALVASDHVVIPVTPEYQPVVGAEQTWQTCGLVQSKLNPRLQTVRFLLTQVDARLNRHERYAGYLRETYRRAVLDTVIRTSSSLAVASRDGQTVFDARVATRGAADYTAAAAAIAGYVFADASGERPSTAAPPAPAASASQPAPQEGRSGNERSVSSSQRAEAGRETTAPSAEPSATPPLPGGEGRGGGTASGAAVRSEPPSPQPSARGGWGGGPSPVTSEADPVARPVDPPAEPAPWRQRGGS